MYLARVEVRNFRCLRELSVDFQQGLNVLVGRNNVGKTSLLAAIRHALGPTPGRNEALWLTEDDFYRPAPGSPRAEQISIGLTFKGLTPRERVFFYEIIEFDHTDVDNSPAVIRFGATWNATKGRAFIQRTGGPPGSNAPDVPSDILNALTVTFLPALRNAEEHLAPGARSRLAQMLRDIARREGDAPREIIEKIFMTANSELEKAHLITRVQESLQKTTASLAGSDYSEPAIRAAGVDFDRILRSLQVLVPGAAVDGLHANGLGFNNLLYMAVVLEHLRPQAEDEYPLLMVEEPEAHLHPQLTALLADHLAKTHPAGHAPQTIVSTHSPTLVAAVPVDRIVLFFTEPETNELRCNSLMHAGLDAREAGAVQRMIDVTRATMFFAKGLILVEGVCEALLLPELAKRAEINLAREHIAVIPICGVAFGTLEKLLGPKAFGVPTAIITDADPPLEDNKANWDEKRPKVENGGFPLSDRTRKLVENFAGHRSVAVYHSKLTLEYDLAEAGDANAGILADAWERCFVGTPRNLTRGKIDATGLSREGKALMVWRSVCLSDTDASKAELAQHLASMLGEQNGCPDFVVPEYIASACRHVAPPRAPATAATPLAHADANS